MIRIIGFTGTQKGMTSSQECGVRDLLQGRPFWAHHGDCIGADAQFDAIARSLPGCLGVHIHPCTLTSKRAYCAVSRGIDHLYVVKAPLTRNKDIVAQSHMLIATPKEETPLRRSGTWATIRYARENGRFLDISIVMPNGVIVQA